MESGIVFKMPQPPVESRDKPWFSDREKVPMLTLDDVMEAHGAAHDSNYDFKKDPMGFINQQAVEDARKRSINLQRQYNCERDKREKIRVEAEERRLREAKERRLREAKRRPRKIPEKKASRTPEKKAPEKPFLSGIPLEKESVQQQQEAVEVDLMTFLRETADEAKRRADALSASESSSPSPPSLPVTPPTPPVPPLAPKTPAPPAKSKSKSKPKKKVAKALSVRSAPIMVPLQRQRPEGWLLPEKAPAEEEMEHSDSDSDSVKVKIVEGEYGGPPPKRS